jgi:hypothetical protein
VECESDVMFEDYVCVTDGEEEEAGTRISRRQE